jgi:hypothetical protein
MTQSQNQAMSHGGIATRASCIAMEKTITTWLAMKYKFIDLDADGLPEYEVPPSKWAKGDLDYVLRWNRFFHQVEHERTMHELHAFVEEARSRKIDTLVMNAVFPIHRPIPWWVKLLGIGGGLYAMKWLMAPPTAMIQAPSINTKPIEDAFMRFAGQEPTKDPTVALEPMVVPNVAVPEEKK